MPSEHKFKIKIDGKEFKASISKYIDYRDSELAELKKRIYRIIKIARMFRSESIFNRLLITKREQELQDQVDKLEKQLNEKT